MVGKKNANKDTKVVNHDVVVTRAIEFDDGGISFNMECNGVAINGCRWVEGEKDGKPYQFVTYPRYKGKDGKYYNHVYVRLSDEDVTTIAHMLEKVLNPE